VRDQQAAHQGNDLGEQRLHGLPLIEQAAECGEGGSRAPVGNAVQQRKDVGLTRRDQQAHVVVAYRLGTAVQRELHQLAVQATEVAADESG